MRLGTVSFLLAAAALAACGGGGSKRASAGASPGAAVVSPAAGMGAAATVAPIPAKLNCGAVQPVWANTRTHVYHTASDPFYGRTRSGQYMCPQQAIRAGYHEGGRYGNMHKGGHKHHRFATPGAMAQPSPSP